MKLSSAAVIVVITGLILASNSGRAEPSKAEDGKAGSTVETPDLDVVVGAQKIKSVGSKEGWMPLLLGGLKQGMTPADVATLFPGADQFTTPKSGVARIQMNGRYGIDELELDFDNHIRKDKALWRVSISFHPKFHTAAFWDELTAFCIAKYGKADPKAVKSRDVSWMGSTIGVSLGENTRRGNKTRRFELIVSMYGVTARRS